MSFASRLELVVLPQIPLVSPGDDLSALIQASLNAQGITLKAGDVLVVAQKIVSKSEGRYVDLATVTPSKKAKALGETVRKDPRLVETILRESTEVIRHRPGVLIVAHHSGVIMANAGIDRSNIAHEDGRETVLLLPKDCDASAERLCDALAQATGVRVGVVVSDSVGRAWRNGTCGLALGVCGVVALEDLRGQPDLFGRPLQVSSVGVADQIAAAAALLMGEGDEGQPVILVRGLDVTASQSRSTDLVRDPAADLFR